MRHTIGLMWLGLALASPLSSFAASDSEDSSPSMTVSAVFPAYQKQSQVIRVSGAVKARQTVTVSAQAAGLILDSILVEVGDNIKKGQLLAQYNDEAVDNDIAQARASLLQATAAARQAEQNAKRAVRLRKSKAMSAVESEKYALQAIQTQGQKAAADAVLKNQLLRKRHAGVTANANGIVTQKQAVVGSVGAMGTPLFTILVDGELEWHAQVPSQSLDKVRIGMPATLELQGSQKGKTSQKITGTVRIIAPTVNSQSAMGTVYVSIAKPGQLREGMFVSGTLNVGENLTLLIPLRSVKRKDGSSYVFIVNKRGIVSQKKVTLGDMYGDSIAVLSGLVPEQRIVSSGVGFIRDGDTVKVLDDAAQ